MIKTKKLLWLVLVLFVILALESSVNIPRLQKMVNDQAGILNSSQERELESMLRNLEQSTSVEIALLTVKDMGGLTIEDYSIRVVDAWKLGKKDRDNGILLLVSTGDRKVRLEVGYGLEESITDAKSSYIINQMVLPYFSEGSYYKGIKTCLTAVSGIVTNTYDITPEELKQYQRQQNKKEKRGGFPTGLIIFILFMLLSRRRRGGLLPWLFLGSMFGGGGSNRSGGFGSGGFGGFSGGGGGFGGGGASGSW